MPQNLSRSGAYQKLISEITRALTSGLLAAQKALEYARLETYWTIGRSITRQVAGSQREITFSDSLYEQISRDLQKSTGLDLQVDTIRRTVQFYKNYPVFPQNTSLTFTHYMALQRVKDISLRLRLEQKAIKNDLLVVDIKTAIAQLQNKQKASPAEKSVLSCARGEPFVYYARRQPRLDGEEIFMIDCGFKISVDFPKNNPFQPAKNRVVRSIKKGEKYRIQQFEEGAGKLYTYQAVVTKVVDGDTIDAQVDVGFGIGLYDRFRLKGIDAPEIDTPAGRLAAGFLKEHFARCPRIILRSIKAEMYGRWLADIFTLPGCLDPYKIAAEGEYLNQTLLDQGLAVVYRQGVPATQ